MSTYAYIKYYVFNKDKTEIKGYADVNVNYMKCCSFGNDWIDELSNMSFDFPKNVKTSQNLRLLPPDEEYIGYASPNLTKKFKDSFKTKSYSTDTKPVESITDSEILLTNYYDTYTDYKSGNIKKVSDINSTDILAGWTLIRKKAYVSQGVWIGLDNCASTETTLWDKIEMSNKEIIRLFNLKNQIDYYRLTDDQKDRIDSDYSSEIQVRDDYKEQLLAVTKLHGALDALYELYSNAYTDFIVGYLYFC